MLWLRSIKVSANPNISSKLDTRHEITNEDVPLLHKIHVEEVRERLGVEDSYNVRINVGEEGEGGRDVCAENRALILLNSLPEESFGALEPEVIEAVGDGA